MTRTVPLPLLIVLPVLAGSGCAPVDGDDAADPAGVAPAVRVVGEGQNCLSRSQIRQSVVRSDRVIDFEMRGGKVFRSILPQRCPGLGLERAITYQTSIDQLCTTEIVYVLQQFGGAPQRGAGCALGEFVPVEYADKTAED